MARPIEDQRSVDRLKDRPPFRCTIAQAQSIYHKLKPFLWVIEEATHHIGQEHLTTQHLRTCRRLGMFGSYLAEVVWGKLGTTLKAKLPRYGQRVDVVLRETHYEDRANIKHPTFEEFLHAYHGQLEIVDPGNWSWARNATAKPRRPVTEPGQPGQSQG